MKSNKIKFSNIKILIPLILIMLLNITSCVKEEFDSPPSNIDDPAINLDANITIKGLKELYNGADTMRITEDYILKATVISSDRRGNFYKQIIVQDETGGMSISVNISYIYEKYPEGQIIYVKCKDLYLGSSGGLTVLGHLFEEDDGTIKHGRMEEELVEEHIIKSFFNKPIEPKTYTIEELKNADSITNTLVRIENVQFKASELKTLFADSENENRHLIDTGFNEIILRTSQYSQFAIDELPQGNGSIIAVFGKYNSDIQLYIKYTDWLDFSGERFYEPYVKDFEDEDIYSGDWTTQLVTGNLNWETSYFSSNNFAKMTNFNYDTYTNSESEVWLISPSFDLTSAISPVLNFRTAMNYDGPALQAKYSTDYDGVSLPATATWTDLAPALSTGSYNWVNSGNLELPKVPSIYVAFIYTGSDSDGATWELDDIGIIEAN